VESVVAGSVPGSPFTVAHTAAHASARAINAPPWNPPCRGQRLGSGQVAHDTFGSNLLERHAEFFDVRGSHVKSPVLTVMV